MADAALTVRPRRPRGQSRREAWAHRLFVTPSVLTLLILGLYPLLFIIAAALSESTLGKPFQSWVGADTLAAVLGDADTVAAFVRTVVYALGVSLASLVLGVVVALALQSAVRGGSLVRTLVLLPMFMPPVVVGTLWKLVYNSGGGLLATVVGFFGGDRQAVAPLSSTSWAMPAIGLADVWEWTPLVALLVFTALVAQDHEIVEAARLDGAHGFRLFWSVTLPSIAGVLAAAFFIRLVLAFKVFDLVFMMTSGGPGQATTTSSYEIYQAVFREFDVGKAAAITLVLAVIVTIVTIPVALITRRLQANHE